MKKIFADLRRDYMSSPLKLDKLDPNPIVEFRSWFHEAVEKEPEANAFVLSTATPGARPSSRVLLLKELDEQGFIFFTNYRSRKGREVQQNPFACLLFYWASLHRQVRAEGTIEAIDPAASDAYFATRPREAQLGAWASHQSLTISNFDELERRYDEMEQRFVNGKIPRPPFWGGYRLTPSNFEFWQGRPNRLHDRVLYRLQGGEWLRERLMP